MRFENFCGLGLADLTPVQRLSAWYYVLLLMAASLLIVFMLTIQLARLARRFRQTYLRPPSKPSPSDDVWRLHRLPPGLEPEEDPEPPRKD